MVRRSILVLCAASLLTTLVGCGGGSGGGGETGISNASFQIVWPDRSRAPIDNPLTSARSVEVVLPAPNDHENRVALTVDRDSTKVEGYTGNYTIPGVIYASKVSVLEAKFYADTGKGGALVGTATAPAAVSGTSVTFGTIVLDRTIKSVQAFPTTLSVGDAPKQLTFTARDADDNAVAVSPGSALWTIRSGSAVIGLTKDGIVTALAAGSAKVRATVDQVASADATITVQPALGPAWTRFHANPQSTGRSGGASGATGSQKWAFDLGGTTWSSPAVAEDGTVYVGQASGLRAISASGVSQWTFSTGASVQSSPAIGDDGTVYFGCKDGKLYAVNPDGSPKWSVSVGSINASGPNFGPDGTIYIGSEDGHLYAVNPVGTVKWAHPTSDLFASPAVAPDGTIYIGANGSKNLYALNPDGTEKWTFGAGGSPHFQSPAVGADGTVYVTSDNGKLYAFGADGTKKWETAIAGSLIGLATSSPAIGADGTVYVGTLGNELVAVSTTGDILWRANVGFAQASPAIDSDGTIYTQGSAYVYAFNPDGSLKWRFNRGGSPASVAIGPDGTIFAPTGDGKLYAIE